MLEKLAQKRKWIAIVYGVILLALFVTHLVWGNAEGKTAVTVATLIALPFFYIGVRVIYKIIRPRASQKVMSVFSWFFLACCILTVVLCLVDFVSLFPNGFDFSLACVFGVSLGILSDVGKNASMDE